MTKYYEVEALRNYLEVTGAKITKVAKEIGMDRKTIWLTLDGCEPSDKTRLKFKKFLNSTIKDIMTVTNYDVDKHTIVRPESFKN
ncbi:hypothetical protein [Lactiplantibacillus plantarum]|uniref:hypothetical protein n=1 Tax=Lactiplantibacillus plantarum TaxID=1590 RepID=UPI000BE379AA|nr:hypothetical protein [Lactiplantibacillus plantarum]